MSEGIDGTLSVEDMRLIVAIGDVFAERRGEGLSLDELGERLKRRGFRVGNGMSREIDDLETKLGGPKSRRNTLLNRRKNGSRLTRMGETICHQLRVLLKGLEEIHTGVCGGRTIIRIGLTNSLTTNFFPRVLRESAFLDTFRDVDLEFVEGEPHELVGLLQSRVDFAVGPKDVTNGADSIPLCEWKRVLLYSRHHKYRHDFSGRVTTVTLREWLRDENVIVPASLIIPRLDDFLRPMVSGRLMIVPQAAVRRMWVERGLGVAISHEEKRVRPNPDDPIGTIDLSEELGTTEMHLYLRPVHRLSPPAQFLVDAIVSTFRSDRPQCESDTTPFAASTVDQ
ncbi:MAG: LysR family transcriptional regulator [Planctomycetaceae bacterium]|nr:LysR family transcriptional regulator [Planctomycetaceae bacterium]